MDWNVSKFSYGDRVVATSFDGAAGTVVRVHDDAAYGVVMDAEELRGPCGDGGIYMTEDELQFEEAKSNG